VLGLFALSLTFYTVARFEFLLWNWKAYRAHPLSELVWPFVSGARFDIAAACMALVPVLVWSLWPWTANLRSRWAIGAYVLHAPVLLLAMIVNLTDSELTNYTGRRFSAGSLFVVRELDTKLIDILASYWLLCLFGFPLMGVVLWTAWRILRPNSGASSIATAAGAAAPAVTLNRGTGVAMYLASAIAAVALLVVGIRGGLQTKPIASVHAHVGVAPGLSLLVLNSTYALVSSAIDDPISDVAYFRDRQSMLANLNGASAEASLLTGTRMTRPQNVVVIILESFSREYSGAYTPFLDSLSRHGLMFQNAFADARQSVDGVPAVLAATPAMMSMPFLASPYAADRLLGPGTVLAPYHYASSFFHGGHNGTMYFDTFATAAGFQHFYGRNEYPNAADDDGAWGIYDEPFLQFMKATLDSTPTPFFSAVFTLSSHNPYRIPSQYRDRFPKGPHPIIESVGYADFALRRFFDAARKAPWFNETLFVITADHTGPVIHPDSRSSLSRFRVPILFFHPTFAWPATINTNQIVQQIDILPSILDFVGVSAPEKSFLGRSVFQPGERTATLYEDGRYLLVADDMFLVAPTMNAVSMYRITDPLERTPVTTMPSRQRHLETRLKATIQYFNNGMRHNQLYDPSEWRVTSR
jgi:phosphoglycerol transferase MdoB-like AlkP superfamily enzyme